MSSGFVMIVIGIAATTFSREFDGFVKGLFQGGGIMLILLGVAVVSARSRFDKDRPGRGWLPSRDGAE